MLPQHHVSALSCHHNIKMHENDIGNVKDFQMKLNLRDDVPVQANYNAIPRNLYKESKNT